MELWLAAVLLLCDILGIVVFSCLLGRMRRKAIWISLIVCFSVFALVLFGYILLTALFLLSNI